MKVVESISDPGQAAEKLLDDIVAASTRDQLYFVGDQLLTVFVSSNPVPHARWLAKRAHEDPSYADALRSFTYTALSIGPEAAEILAPWTDDRV